MKFRYLCVFYLVGCLIIIAGSMAHNVRESFGYWWGVVPTAISWMSYYGVVYWWNNKVQTTKDKAYADGFASGIAAQKAKQSQYAAQLFGTRDEGAYTE